MGSFVSACLVVWLAVFGYLLCLDLRQRRLLRAAEALQSQLAQSEDRSQPITKAA